MPIKHQIRTILTPVSSEAPKAKQMRPDAPALRIAPIEQKIQPAIVSDEIEEQVARSVQTVERAVENLSALKDNCDYYMNMASELRRELEQEREDRKDADKALDELDHQLRSEATRAELAEERLSSAETNVRQLEDELEKVRSQTERLVETISMLVSPINTSGHQADHLAA